MPKGWASRDSKSPCRIARFSTDDCRLAVDCVINLETHDKGRKTTHLEFNSCLGWRSVARKASRRVGLPGAPQNDIVRRYFMNARKRFSRLLLVVGGIAMLVGAVDPMEGSLLILPGSGLFALGTFLGQSERRLIAYRVCAFVLIAIGVGALWGLSLVGGIGGSSEVFPWWAVLMLPYPIGWSMGIWGPGSPRWMLWLGIGVGLWYLSLVAIALQVERHVSVNIFIAAVGLLTIGGCVYRLTKQTSE